MDADPIIPPTSIDWIGDRLVAAVLLCREGTRCGNCGGRLAPIEVPDKPNITSACVECGTWHGERP